MTTILSRRGSAAAWTSANSVLANGERGLETDTGKEKIGNGSTAWNALGYTLDSVVKTSDIDGVTLGVGYDIVLCAGQSNMAGRGTAYDLTRMEVISPRVFQYGNSGGYAGQISQAVEPLLHHETPPGMGPATMFARWYAASVAGKRSVLLVPVAHGDTGFTTTSLASPPAGYTTATTGGGGWDPSGGQGGINLYENMIAQLQAAIVAAGANSRVAAILWVQGEADAAMTQAAYAAKLDSLIDGIRTRVPAAANAPFVIGQMNPDYIAAGSAVNPNAAHIDTPYRKTLTGFAYGAAGHTTAGQPPHYDAAGYRLLGRSLFDALPLAIVNVMGVASIAPSAVTLTQTGTSLGASWTRPTGRATDYTVQYRVTGAGSWTTLSRSRSIDVTATIPSLILGTSYDVRVSTVNEQGTSAASATATLMLATTPAQVTGLAAGTSTSSTVPLAWTVVTGATSYLVEQRLAAGAWTTTATVTTNAATAVALVSSSSYTFRVTAINAAGSGTVSSTAAATTAAAIKLLDDVGVTAYRAYGLRKLRTAFAGSAVRVRRSSDSTEQDIGFSGEDLDTTALLTFAGAGSAYVKVFYDQSGSARDLTQATTTLQPRIVNAGTLDAVGGRAVAVFDGVDDQFTSVGGAALYNAGASSGLLVLKATTPAVISAPIGEGNAASGNARFLPLYSNTSGNIASIFRDDTTTNMVNASSSVAIFNAAKNQMSYVDDGSTLSTYGNAALAAATAYSRSGRTLTLTAFSLGAFLNNTGQYFCNMQFSEAVLWNSALTGTQRQTGEANQKTYHGTP